MLMRIVVQMSSVTSVVLLMACLTYCGSCCNILCARLTRGRGCGLGQHVDCSLGVWTDAMPCVSGSNELAMSIFPSPQRARRLPVWKDSWAGGVSARPLSRLDQNADWVQQRPDGFVGQEQERSQPSLLGQPGNCTGWLR